MRRGRRIVATGLVLGLAALAEPDVGPTVEREPRSLRLDVPDEVALPAAGFAVRPDVTPPPSAAQALERRLQALAAAVEARSLRRVDAALVEFDVEGLVAAIEAILVAGAPKSDVSVHVRDLESQHVLFDYFGDTPLIPASNQKLVTSAAALDLLGSDYTFATAIGVRNRDMFVRGEGDPSLSVEDLAAIADTIVHDVDLATIDRLVVDDFAFSARSLAPGYREDGPGYAYEAPSGALSCNFNTIEVTVFPTKKPAGVGVHVVPATGNVVVENKARLGRRRTLSVVTRGDEDGRTVVRVEGLLPKRSRPAVFRRRVHDPGLFTGSVLATVLGELSASEPLPVAREPMPDDADVLFTRESSPLIEVLDQGLAYSNNFIAEQVLRTLAWRMTGDPGDWEAGQQILHDYWSVLIGDPDELVVENAAGLTRRGRASSSGLVDLITLAHRASTGGAGLIDALPVAGEAGTLRTRLRLSGKRVRAKTGTLSGVSGLTGVITREDGTPQIGFSILINAGEGSVLDADGRRAVEDAVVTEVLRALDDYEAQRAGVALPRGGVTATASGTP